MMFQTNLLALAASVLLFTTAGVAGFPQDIPQGNPPTVDNTTNSNTTIDNPTPDNTVNNTTNSNTTVGTNTTVGGNTTTSGCPGTIVDIIQQDPTLTSLSNWIQQEPAALSALCNQSSNYTVFAPTNNAFAELSTYLSTVLGRPEANTERALILGYHIYPGNLALTNVSSDNPLKLETLAGSDVIVERTNITTNDTNNGTLGFGLGTYRVNGVNVVAPVASSTNGEVVPIDLILRPSYTKRT